MCPSEHLQTAVSPGTSAGLEVSIRRTVTLSPQLSHVNPRHKKFGMAYRFTLPSALVMKAVRNRSQLTRSAAVLHVLVVARVFISRVECEFQFFRKLLKFPGVSLSGKLRLQFRAMAEQVCHSDMMRLFHGQVCTSLEQTCKILRAPPFAELLSH